MTLLNIAKVLKILWPFVKEVFITAEDVKERRRQQAVFTTLVIVVVLTMVDVRQLIGIEPKAPPEQVITTRERHPDGRRGNDPVMSYLEDVVREQIEQTATLQSQLEETLQRLDQGQIENQQLRETVRQLQRELERVDQEVDQHDNPRDLYESLRNRPD